MAVRTDTDFESYPPPNNSEAGTVANIGQSTVQCNSGPNSMRALCASAAQAWMRDTLTGRSFAGRVMFRPAVSPGGSTAIVAFTLASGNPWIQMTAANLLRVRWGTASTAPSQQNGPTISLNAWHLLQWGVDTSGGTSTFNWAVDGVAQTAATKVQAAADMTTLDIGNITSVTCDMYFDDYYVTDNAADHPIALPGWLSPAGQSGLFGV